MSEYFVDCDFQQQFRLGYRGGFRAEPAARDFPVFEEHFPHLLQEIRDIPERDWQEYYDRLTPDNAGNKWWQYNQRNEGTCTSNAQAGCMAYCFTKQFGINIAPAPTPMYRKCARSANSGSSTNCILKQSRDQGTILIDTPENREVLSRMGLDPSHVVPATGWNYPIPRGALEDTAPHFRVLEVYTVRSILGFFAGVFNSFDGLYGRSGHAIHAVDPIFRSGAWHIKYDNSWGDWGDNGFGYDSKSYLSRTGAVSGAFFTQSMVESSGVNKYHGIKGLS